MREHPDFIELKRLFPAVYAYQQLAKKHGIDDIFQDNGGKILQVCLALGLVILKPREGNDAIDETGREYELKTVNILKQRQFTTHHHLNPVILKKYRLVDWIFTTYEGIEMKEIYLMSPGKLEVWFTKWEQKWHSDGGRDINNPKIPLEFVKRKGIRLYPTTPEEAKRGVI